MKKGGNGPKMQQIFLWKDRRVTESFVRRAEALGFKGIVVTIGEVSLLYSLFCRLSFESIACGCSFTLVSTLC